MKPWAAAFAVCALAGCLSSGPREAQRYFLLEDAGAKAAPSKPAESAPARAGTLLLAPGTSSSFYDTQGIAYSRAPGQRAFYQHSSWTEAPGRRIGALLAARLERGGGFAAVASATSPVRGDLLLSTQLSELYHDAAAAPGVVRIALSAELTDPARRTLVARKSFSASAPAPTYDAAGAVQAFSRALATLLDELSAWVEENSRR